MKYIFKKGYTSAILTVTIQDSSSSTGAGLAGLDESSSIVGGYVRAGGTGVALAVDENVTTEGTYQAPSAADKVRIGTPANMRPGTYELHIHNDLLAAGVDSVYITLGGATNMADLPIEIQLTDLDLNDGVRGAMTALPNAAADAAGGLPISDAGGLDLDALNTAAVRLTAARAQVLDDWINAGRLDAILDAIKVVTDALTDPNTVADALLVRQMTEDYNADGTAPTVAQAFCLLIAACTEFAISGTTLTAKKLDGSTTAATFTLDSATDPTSITRAS